MSPISNTIIFVFKTSNHNCYIYLQEAETNSISSQNIKDKLIFV